SLGRLATSSDAAGHSLNFSRAPESVLSATVTKSTSLGVSRQYSVVQPVSGGSTWTNTLPDGTTFQEQLNADGSVTVIAPDGTRTTSTSGPDPRFGMQVPVG